MTQRRAVNVVVTCCMLLTVLSILAACAGTAAPSYTKRGTMRDTMYSVEHRGNGAVIVWPTHSDKEGYCFPYPKRFDNLDNLLLTHDGEVVIAYESQSPSVSSPRDPERRCYLTESGVTFTVQIAISITKVASR